jgi:predicted SPOUT superfamily RNA methylase MTH1
LVQPASNPKKLTVAIPASLVSDTPHLREKTAKLGIIARSCAIFGVEEVMIYTDDMRRSQQEDINLCAQVLNFIETPQYLRKRMFKLSPELRFTGILPPLQTPHHNVPTSLRQCKVGDTREGIIVGRHANSVLVDVGLERTIQCLGELQLGSRVTVRLRSLEGKPTGEIVNASKQWLSRASNKTEYWGYRVRKMRSLGKLLRDGDFNLKIGTSRYGTSILNVWSRLNVSIGAAESLLVAFGSPSMGLREILEQEHQVPEDLFDYFINTLPNQDVATVRTEEAVLVTLGLLNVGALLQ